jgi:type VI secretion system protein ImpE
MTAEEHIRAGDLEGALQALHDAIKKNPADAKLRVFLFQLLCVNGQWEKALTQLNLIADISPDSMLLAQIFRPVIQCEALRSEVFAGKRSPLIFGEPQEWLGLLVHANSMVATGNLKEARETMNRALEDAPAVAGSINEHDFEWIADADSRLGPVLEAVIDGKYYWVPFNRVAQIHITRPSDLRDLVWIAATFTWSNGGESSGLIPVRYAGSEKSTESGIRLSRRTDWQEAGHEFFLGQGQRLFATDQGEYPLLETLIIKFNHPVVPAEASPEEAAAPAPAAE